ncbi:hypothetical protein TrVGV298_001363 [Trichoderma virens]|nr:hypothetical protein TrVGV298_001363 [Trichoderma virens]
MDPAVNGELNFQSTNVEQVSSRDTLNKDLDFVIYKDDKSHLYTLETQTAKIPQSYMDSITHILKALETEKSSNDWTQFTDLPKVALVQIRGQQHVLFLNTPIFNISDEAMVVWTTPPERADRRRRTSHEGLDA